MLDAGPGSFFLPVSKLSDSPSSRDGIPLSSQDALRFYACEVIQEAGILLRLPQAVMATAQVLFHRFFCKRSFRDFDARAVAASCLWLSIKLEEAGRWNRGEKPSLLVDLLNVFERVRSLREGEAAPTPDCSGFKVRKEELLRLETLILVELGFVCHVEHPHKFLLGYLNCLDATPKLVQEAWNLVNDSLRTTLCVRFPSYVVACGCIYAAARRLFVPLPDSPPWWLLFDVTLEQILEVCYALADLYRKPKPHYVEVRGCSLSESSVADRLQEISNCSGDVLEKVDRLTSVQSCRAEKRCESASYSSCFEDTSVETAKPASDGTSVQQCQDIRQSDDSLQGVEHVCGRSLPSVSTVIDFCVINAPGAPVSKGVLLGGMLMAHPKIQRKDFKRSGDLVCKRDCEDSRHSLSHDLFRASMHRDRRNAELSRREGWWRTEYKRRRTEDFSFRRSPEDRCSARYSHQKKYSHRHNCELIRG